MPCPTIRRTYLNENPAPKKAQDTDWQCCYCLKWHPVQILARDCEQKHKDGR